MGDRPAWRRAHRPPTRRDARAGHGRGARRGRRLRRGLLSLAPGAVVVAIALIVSPFSVAVPPGEGGGPLDVGYYSHSASGCASRVDPIKAYFYTGATTARTTTHISQHTGWGRVVVTNGQWLADAGVCRAEDEELANGQWYEQRYHIRLREITDRSNGYTTVGTPHYELFVNKCGHAVYPTRNGVSGYEIAAQRLYDGMAGADASRYEYWGNTQPFWQSCGGWYAQGNGWVRAFSVTS